MRVNLIAVFTCLFLVCSSVFGSVKASFSFGSSVEVTFDAGGDDTQPVLCTYQDELWLVWVTTNQEISTGADSDIVAKKFDGNAWSQPFEICSQSNAEADSTPTAEVFNNRLYVAWATNDPVESNGTDWDIVIRYYDGTGWGTAIEITETGDSGNDFSPHLCVFQERLYVAWQTWDDSAASGPDSDIVLKSFDGISWSQVPKATPGNDGNDYFPFLTAYENKLYLLWSPIGNDPNEADYDVFIRVFDGSQWGPPRELNLAGDMGEDLHPFATVYENKLYIAWQTSDNIMSTGTDDDIVLRSFDGSEWSEITEVTSPVILGFKDTESDAFPILASFSGSLFVIWQTNDPATSNGYDYDMVSCQYSEGKWSKVMELTMPENTGYDGGVTTVGYDAVEYKGQLLIFWETIDIYTSTGNDKDIVEVMVSSEVTSNDNGSSTSDGTRYWPILIAGIVLAVAIMVAGYTYFRRKKRD